MMVMAARPKAFPGMSMTVSMLENTAKAAMEAVPKVEMVDEIRIFPTWKRDFSMVIGMEWLRI